MSTDPQRPALRGESDEMSESKIENIARVCHEANRAYCLAIGDDSQPRWEDAPDWQRESAVNGVQFHMDNPYSGAALSHQSWLREKEAAGWKYGPVKDPEKKEHPCMVRYCELSVEQRMKDHLFVAIVDALREMPSHA